MIRVAIEYAVTLDLSGTDPCDSRQDRHALAGLARMPAGARVTVRVGSRPLLTQDVVTELLRHAERLHITIDAAEPDVAQLWRRAIVSDPVVDRVGGPWS